MNSIVYKKFRLSPCENAIGKFDLYGPRTRIKKETNESYEVEDLIGYGFTIPEAIKQISFIETSNNITEDKVELKNYLEKFLTIKNEILKEFEELLKVKQF